MRGAAVISALSLVTLTVGCGPTFTVPNVVGMRLDAAHRVFEKMDVTKFSDQDVVGDEDSIWRDANWVVVKQEPAAGTADVDKDQTITLLVGNEDDDEVLDMIPPDSEFAVEVAEDRAAEAEEEAADEAEDQKEAQAEEAERAAEMRADAKEYARKIDTALARNVQGVMRLYVANAAAVRRQDGGSVVAAENALAAQNFFDQTVTSLSTRDVSAPDSLDLDSADDDMLDAMLTMSRACEELLVAIDTGAPSAFAREWRLREEAVSRWNAAMRNIYRAAGRQPVVIPLGR